MTTLIYAGIGSRATPRSVLAAMTKMAAWLTRTGWHLASGGRDGADTAFAGGAPAGQRTLYLPWLGYNGHAGPDCRTLSRSELADCMDVAARLHPAWHRCSPAARKLHARNVHILRGSELDRPVDAVVAWTRDAAVTGGTGMGLRIAAAHGIPVMVGRVASRPGYPVEPAARSRPFGRVSLAPPFASLTARSACPAAR